jgi:hypothetical protein
MPTQFERIMFLNERVVSLFLVIGTYNVHQASLVVGFNYLQSRKYVKYWEELGLIRLNKKKGDKSYHINYTAKGQRIVDVLLAAKTVLQNQGIQFKK